MAGARTTRSMVTVFLRPYSSIVTVLSCRLMMQNGHFLRVESLRCTLVASWCAFLCLAAN